MAADSGSINVSSTTRRKPKLPATSAKTPRIWSEGRRHDLDSRTRPEVLRGLVQKSSDASRREGGWPGIGSAAALLSGRSIEGIWEDRTKAWQLRRQGQKVRRNDVVGKTSLQLVPLPAWRELPEAQRRAKVLAMVQKVEAEARTEREQTGREPMGREKILRQSPLSTPATPRKASPAPLFHARGEIFLRLLHAYREFKAAFRQAAELLRSGDKNAPFPPGSFPPALPFVRGKPPPFTAQPA